jgi:hypothetical protein
MSNDKFNTVGNNIAEKATMIWNVADMLRGPFKPHEYGLVILPMTVVNMSWVLILIVLLLLIRVTASSVRNVERTRNELKSSRDMLRISYWN